MHVGGRVKIQSRATVQEPGRKRAPPARDLTVCHRSNVSYHSGEYFGTDSETLPETFPVPKIFATNKKLNRNQKVQTHRKSER